MTLRWEKKVEIKWKTMRTRTVVLKAQNNQEIKRVRSPPGEIISRSKRKQIEQTREMTRTMNCFCKILRMILNIDRMSIYTRMMLQLLSWKQEWGHYLWRRLRSLHLAKP